MKLLVILILSTLIGCKGETHNQNIRKDSTIDPKISKIDTLAVIYFRRSYADHHLLSKRELEELYKSNPSLENYDYDQHKNLFNELENLKILDKKELILRRFENVYSKETKYIDNEKQISFKYDSDFRKSNSINIKMEKDGILTEKKIDFGRENFIGLILEDVDKDGIKEILILLNYYIMNGDNYILMINKFVV
jgi:hypothetical protein